MRERGLKYSEDIFKLGFVTSRSREGAWIEITPERSNIIHDYRRSREGAWIEIVTMNGAKYKIPRVAPVRERGLKLLV